MRKASWTVKLLTVFIVCWGLLLLFQMCWVLPLVRNRETELTGDCQLEIARGVARQLDWHFRAARLHLEALSQQHDGLESLIAEGDTDPLSDHMVSGGLLSALWAVDRDGAIRAKVSRHVITPDLPPAVLSPALSAALGHARPWFSPPFQETGAATMSACVGVPILGSAGDVVGVIVGAVDLSDVTTVVRDFAAVEGQYVYLVDAEGRLLAHSGMQLRTPQAATATGETEDRPFLKAIVNGDAVAGLEHVHGAVKYFGSLVRLRTNGWGVVVEIPLPTVLAQSNSLARHLFPLEIATFFSALLIILLISNQISRTQEQGENALKLSEGKYRDLVEGSDSVIMRLDSDGNITFLNRVGQSLLGFDQDDLLGRTADGLLLPDRRTETGEMSVVELAAYEPNRFHRAEGELRTKDGDAIWMTWMNKAVIDAEGKMAGLLSIGTDMSDKRRFEEELTRREAALRAMMNALKHPAFLVDPRGTVVAANEETGRAFGRQAADLLGRSVFSCLSPEQSRRAKRQTTRVLRRKQPSDYDEEHGGRAYRVTLYPVFGPGGDVEKLAALAYDWTELRSASEKLRAGEARIRMLIQRMADAIVVADHGGRIRFVNAAAEALFGRDRADLIGNTLPFTFHNTRQTELTLPAPDGSPRNVEVRLVPLEWDNVPCRLASLRDVTDRKREEAERIVLLDHVREAEKIRSLRVVAGGVVHEFNNILQAIVGNTELLGAQFDPGAPGAEELEGIRTGAERAATLTKRMLEYCGRRPLRAGRHSLSEVASGVSALLGALVPRDAHLHYDLAPGLPSFPCDPEQLHQVILNLVVNGFEALPDSQGDVFLTTGITDVGSDELTETVLGDDVVPGEMVFVEVKDTGSGMDPSTKSRIFDPFFSTKFTGRGLGLASVLGIVGSHGGTVWVESQTGQGTTVRVLFPLDGSPLGQL